MSNLKEIKTSVFISFERPDVNKKQMVSMIKTDIDKLNELLDDRPGKASEVARELMKYERGVLLQTLRQLNTFRASDSKNVIIDVLENGNLQEQITFFEENAGIMFLEHYQARSASYVDAALVEITTADNYCIQLQKDGCDGSNLYMIEDAETELFYNSEDPSEFFKQHLCIGGTFYADDHADIIEAISDCPEFIDEIALEMVTKAAAEAGEEVLNDLDDE